MEDRPACVSITDVQHAVARAFCLSISEMLSRKRRHRLTGARQVAMYLSREMAGGGWMGRRRQAASFPRIGLAFARDHTSVIHACNVVARRRLADADFGAARETAQTIREDHFALPKVAAEDGAEPQANRNRGEVNSMLGFIVEIIGEEAAAKLIARFGGTRLYVPHSPCPDDALALAVGTGAAMKLAEMFGGERVELPKPPPRRMQILTLRAAGRSVEEIARALNCTRRRVFQVLAEARREVCAGAGPI